MDTLLTDMRSIKSINWPGPHCGRHQVGSFGVTKIVPYLEHGKGTATVWLAVYQEKKILQRVNTTYIESVVYEVEE